MKKRLPGILIFIGLMLLLSQILLYRSMVQRQVSYDVRFGRYDNNVETIFHIDFPDIWNLDSIQIFLGQVIGKYFLVIIALLMLFSGLRMALYNKWSDFHKLLSKNIKILIEKHGLPDQKIELADGSSIYIYGELDEAASKKHKVLKVQELGADASKLPNDELNIYDYYIVKANREGVMMNCRKYKFEGLFTDANEIDNWDDFLNH
jgi:hypothetical protein